VWGMWAQSSSEVMGGGDTGTIPSLSMSTKHAGALSSDVCSLQ
jgi:hypothetical protein